MRDPRFVAAHRGGRLSKANHRKHGTFADTIAKDLLAVREQVKIFRQFFQLKQIEYVGVGYNW